MACINFGQLDKNLIPILIGSIFCFLSRLLFNFVETVYYDHAIISSLFCTAPKLLTFIPFIIFKYRTKRLNNKDNINNNNIEERFTHINVSNNNNNKKNKYLLLLLSCMLYSVQSIILIYTIKIKTNTWFLDILFTCLFYFLIFKIKLYKHHYLSILLIILSGLVYDLISESIQNDINNNIYKLLLRLLREIIYSLYDVVNKYLIDKKACSVYELALSNGIFDVSFLGFLTIFNFIGLNIDEFDNYFNNINTKELLVIFADMITQIGLYLSTLFTNKNNTPCHLFIIFVIGKFAYHLDISFNSSVYVLFFLFILFISLILNEIIEINCYGLSQNTKRNIIKRAEEDNLSKKWNPLTPVDVKSEDNNSEIETYDRNYTIKVELESKDDVSV